MKRLENFNAPKTLKSSYVFKDVRILLLKEPMMFETLSFLTVQIQVQIFNFISMFILESALLHYTQPVEFSDHKTLPMQISLTFRVGFS